MDNDLKDSYRIGKILKKLTGLKFLKSKQTVDLSNSGKKQAQAYLSSQKPEKPAASPSTDPNTQTEKYIRYQKELEAARLLGSKHMPKPPGRILKLPTGRKEIMSRSED